MGEGAHEVFPVFRPAPGKEKGIFLQHTSMKWWVLQLIRNFPPLMLSIAKYVPKYSHRLTVL